MHFSFEKQAFLIGVIKGYWYAKIILYINSWVSSFIQPTALKDNNSFLVINMNKEKVFLKLLLYILSSKLELKFKPFFFWINVLLKSSGVYLFHSWHGFTDNGPRQNIARLWKLFSYTTIRILKISPRNRVSLPSTHYRAFLLTGPFDLTKAIAFNPA